MLKRLLMISVLAAVPFYISACAINTAKQLERVAKDWCLTIRASQVLPVYPLSEDIQPGDVFLVQTPLSKQTEIYKDKGFLALDQLVTRLSNLNYSDFYKDAYWKGIYASTAHQRPGWPSHPGANTLVEAPRAAFPTYKFSVKRGGGIQVAIPIQGIPVGLGLMGASRASGTVTIKDAYTYGIDGECIGRLLYNWWESTGDVAWNLKAIANGSKTPIYLRVVTRVYLAGSVEVSLVNLDAVSGGLDVAQAPKLQLPDLSQVDPEKVKVSVEAYQAALNAISQPLNAGGISAPGGAVRLAYASQRSVTMTQVFDRPLVIGYLGFDAKVFEDGTLSAPIPSFSVISGYLGKGSFVKAIKWSPNPLSKKYMEWLRKQGNREKMVEWLKKNKVHADPADLRDNDDYLPILKRAAKELGFDGS